MWVSLDSMGDSWMIMEQFGIFRMRFHGFSCATNNVTSHDWGQPHSKPLLHLEPCGPWLFWSGTVGMGLEPENDWDLWRKFWDSPNILVGICQWIYQIFLFGIIHMWDTNIGINHMEFGIIWDSSDSDFLFFGSCDLMSDLVLSSPQVMGVGRVTKRRKLSVWILKNTLFRKQ